MYWDFVIAFNGNVGHTGYMARGPADGSRLWITTQTHGRDTINGQAAPNASNRGVMREGNYIIVTKS